MMIDIIVDRVDAEARGDWDYSARQFYYAALDYKQDDISRAMDCGTAEDVKEALCEYIEEEEYNLELCKYINDRVWLEDMDSKHGKGHMEGRDFVLNREVA